MTRKSGIPYYHVNQFGIGHWKPGRSARALGFSNVRCGKDGKDARDVARLQNILLKDARHNISLPPKITKRLPAVEMINIDPAKSYVYFLQDGSLLKIGQSTAVVQRIQSIRTGNGHPLRLIGLVEGDQEREFRLHQQYRRFRVSGEWFQFNDELKAAVRAINCIGGIVNEKGIPVATPARIYYPESRNLGTAIK